MQKNNNKNKKNKYHQISRKASFRLLPTTTMSKKKKAFIEAICDAYGFDYPERDYEDPEDTRSEDELYEDKLDEYDFTSGCYINHEWLSIARLVEIAEDAGLFEEDEF